MDTSSGPWSGTDQRKGLCQGVDGGNGFSSPEEQLPKFSQLLSGVGSGFVGNGEPGKAAVVPSAPAPSMQHSSSGVAKARAVAKEDVDIESPKRRRVGGGRLREVTGFEKADGVTDWAKDVIELRQDTDRTKTEALAHLATWRRMSTKLDKVVTDFGLKEDVVEGNVGAACLGEMLEERTLTEESHKLLSCLCEVAGLLVASNHGAIDAAAAQKEDDSIRSFVKSIELPPGQMHDALIRLVSINSAFLKGKAALQGVQDTMQLKEEKKQNVAR